MKLQLVKPSMAAMVGWLLALPSLYFILISVLKYGFGVPGLFNASEPVLHSLGANKPLGWNINLLLLFGPVLSLLLNFSAILSVNWQRGEDAFHLQLSLERRWANWVVLLVSGGCLAVLFLYALGESCRC